MRPLFIVSYLQAPPDASRSAPQRSQAALSLISKVAAAAQAPSTPAKVITPPHVCMTALGAYLLLFRFDAILFCLH